MNRRAPLRRVSGNRARENRARVEMLKAKYGLAPVLCEICGQREANDPHEPLMRSRGGSIIDPDNVMAVCRTCHDAAGEDRNGWATARGFLVHSWDRFHA